MRRHEVRLLQMYLIVEARALTGDYSLVDLLFPLEDTISGLQETIKKYNYDR